jgi:hypothetical protein
MRKILAGVIGMLILVATISGSAYALFSSNVTVTGVTFATGTASLQVLNPSTGNWGTNWYSGWNFSGLYPGATGTAATDIQLRNNSTAAITMAITGALTNTGTGWNSSNLKYAIEVRFEDVTAGGVYSSWNTLSQLNASPATLPNTIAQGASRTYRLHYRVSTTYVDGPSVGTAVGNEIAGQSLTDLGFTFTGTQQ